MIAWQETTIRLVLALALGGLVGWQRETAVKPAGLRTHILVSVGAALFTLISRYGFFESGADPSRVASNIVVGIGFLGAGTIWRTGASIQGLTTAASLWTVAALGMAAGIGYYWGAVLGTLIVLGVLTYMKDIEQRIRRRGLTTLRAVTADKPGQLGRIGTVLGSFGIDIEHVEFEPRVDGQVTLDFSVRVPNNVNRQEVLGAAREISDVTEVDWEDGTTGT